MKNLAPDELKPSEATLAFIRQFAHTYRVIRSNNGHYLYSLN